MASATGRWRRRRASAAPATLSPGVVLLPGPMRSRRWDLVLVVLELLVTSRDSYDVTATRQRPHPESGDHVDGSAPGAGKCEPPARRGADADDDRRLVIHGRTRLPASVRPFCARPTHHALPRAVRFMHRTGMICTDRWHVRDPRERLSHAHGDFLSGNAGPASRDTPSYASSLVFLDSARRRGDGGRPQPCRGWGPSSACPEVSAGGNALMLEKSRVRLVWSIPGVSAIEDALRQRRRLTEVANVEHRRLGCSCRDELPVHTNTGGPTGGAHPGRMQRRR
jgi:hypothetical protein